jgi:membrane-bound serine protease (ClpP class)
MRHYSLFAAWTAVCLFIVVLCAPVSAQVRFHVTRVVVSGAISPAQDELLDNALSHAVAHDSDLLLMVLDTPGGLGESMRAMVSTMLNSSIPVAVWVGPAGARAASAGVFLVAASAVAGMAPQTSIGAASPVGLGGAEISETMARKVTNDFSSLVRGVAKSHGRNSQWYESAVTESVSITADEALALKVVEQVAPTDHDFLVQAGRAGVSFAGQTLRFDSDELEVTTFEPGFRYDFLSWLLHPQVAYLLLMGGLLGLFIEITHPGTVFPGVFGGLCLVLALYAMSVLPTNATGLLLVGFALILFVLEIKVISYGLLTVAGVCALFVGSVLLFRDDSGTLRIPLSFIMVPVVLVSAAAVGLIYLVARSQKIVRPTGLSAMVGQVGEVRSWEGESGQIFIRGEIWAANRVSADFTPCRGMIVQVVSVNGLTLEIGPLAR